MKTRVNTRIESTLDRRHDKAINQLAREWADYVGGLTQARKVVRDAFEAGLHTGIAITLNSISNPQMVDSDKATN